LSDYAGHGQDMQIACQLLETIDQVLEGLLEAWDDQDGLVLITSDHGNLEDLSTRRHTANPVPALLIGAPELRRQFSAGLENLTGVAPAILRTLQVSI
jgi:2,3-bisphosphoglycerate-independent phosphoglycerate mutase